MNDSSAWPRVVDLQFLGRPGRISAGAIDTPAGVLVVDPGPASCLPALVGGLAALGCAPRDLHGLLLTHIHLDHAGAAGTIVRQHPHVKVYVHGRGAPHLVDPAKLLASATQLYGDQMDRLWGEFAAVPTANLVVPADGAVLDVGGARFDVAYTAGHASHHACYRDRRSGVVFAGDTGGIRVGPSPYVLPPTPPPDIDVRAWQVSLARVRAWEPSGVFISHFGLYRDAAAHLDALGRELDAWDQNRRDDSRRRSAGRADVGVCGGGSRARPRERLGGRGSVLPRFDVPRGLLGWARAVLAKRTRAGRAG